MSYFRIPVNGGSPHNRTIENVIVGDGGIKSQNTELRSSCTGPGSPAPEEAPRGARGQGSQQPRFHHAPRGHGAAGPQRLGDLQRPQVRISRCCAVKLRRLNYTYT